MSSVHSTGTGTEEDATCDGEEVMEEMASGDAREEDEVVLSWLEQVGRHVVGADVMRVMTRMMCVLKAFVRAWVDDDEDD